MKLLTRYVYESNIIDSNYMEIQDFDSYGSIEWFKQGQSYTTRQVINKMINSSYTSSYDMERLIYKKFLEYLSNIDLKNDFDAVIVEDDTTVIVSRNSSYAFVIDTDGTNIEDVDYIPVHSMPQSAIGKKIIDFYTRAYDEDYVKYIFDVEVCVNV